MRQLIVLTLMAALALAAGQAGAQTPKGRVPSAVLEPTSTVARWPDSITCRFPQRPATDVATGQASGKMLKAYTQVSHLTLAPGSDGRFYYSDGPATANDNATSNTHWPDPVLVFNSDGTQFGQTRSDCSGRTIAQLIASGQAH